MKTAAILLIVLVLAAGSCLGYGLFNSSLQVIGKGLQVFSAEERAAEFETLRMAVAQQSLIGTMLRSGELGPAADYSYYMYTLRIKNPGLIDAQMVEMQISPLSQDVLFYGDPEEIIIPAGQTRDIWCVLLTRGEPHAVRDIYITYYLWGHPQEVKFTYDNTI